MFKNAEISRREFVLGAGGVVLFAATASARASVAGAVPFEALVRRCGVPRLGYSCAGGIAGDLVAARHREQLAFLLALCGTDIMPSVSSTAPTEVRSGSSEAAARMTSLQYAGGLRLEVITSGAALTGPELTLHGDAGSLYADAGGVWFDGDGSEICAWRSDAFLLPDACRADFLAAREGTALPERYAVLAGAIMQSATTASCLKYGVSAC